MAEEKSIGERLLELQEKFKKLEREFDMLVSTNTGDEAPVNVTVNTVYGWFKEILQRRRRLYRDDVIHVSEVSGCLRRAWYTRRFGETIGDAKAVVMNIGNGVHEALQDLLRTKGWRTEYPVEKTFRNFRLVGHIDLWHPKAKVVLEIKTVNKLPEKPYEGHLQQINAYMHLLREKDVRGYLVYISRDGNIRVFNTPKKTLMWNQFIKRAYYLYYSLRDNKPPKREKGPLCQYCEYRWQCLETRKPKTENELASYDDFIEGDK